MNEDQELSQDQELAAIVDIGLMEANPRGYLAAMQTRMIEQFQAESHKPLELRDYDRAMQSVVRAFLAIGLWIAQREAE